MSVLSDPAYIVHNLRLSNLRLDDRTSDKVITFPSHLLSNEYIKTAGPTFPEMQYCYSPNISHDYMMLNNNSLLFSSENAAGESSPGMSQATKPAYGGRAKYDRRRVVAAQAAAAAAAAGLGRGGIEGGASSTAYPMQPAPVPAMRVSIPMAAASMESDDDIDIDDEDPVKSPPKARKMTIPTHIGGSFAPGIFITTPSRPGSAIIPEDVRASRQATSGAEAVAGTSPGRPEHNLQTELEHMEREIDIGDVTIDSMNSPIDLSLPDSASITRTIKNSVPTHHALVSPLPARTNSPSANIALLAPMDEHHSEPLPLTQPSPVSLLTSLIIQQKSREDNPFAEEFLRVAGMGETSPVQLKIYLPSSDKPKDPMQVVVKREATVEDVIGYILYQYYNEGRTPHLSDELSTVVQWNMRIVEDDGEIDDDLPAVERTLKIGRFSMNQRFAMNQFALCEATPAQAQINEALYLKSGRTVVRPKRKQASSSGAGLGPPDSPSTEANAQGESRNGQAAESAIVDTNGADGSSKSGLLAGAGAGGSGTIGTASHIMPPRVDPLIASTQHYVRVHLHTNHEVKHTTTVEIMPKMLVSGVIDYICGKRKMTPAEWSLVVADTHHVLPLDGAAEDISNTTELALVPKVIESNTPVNRSRFGRNGPADIPGSGVSYLTSTEVYREYILNRKRRGGYVGHHEQVLAIDGDYIRIMPSSTKMLLFDSGKTASYLKNTVHDCRQSRKAPNHFKLIVIRGDREKKTYEFEAKTQQQAHEICQRIMQLKNN